MVTNTAHGLKIIKHTNLSRSRHYTLAAGGIMNISPNRPFYIIVSNFFDREVRFPKHVKIAQTAEPPSIINAMYTEDREAFPIGTPETSTTSEFNSSDGTGNPQASLQENVLAVHYKVAESTDSQVPRHTALIEFCSQNVRDWQEEVKLTDKYSQYRDECVNMHFEFQSM